jgi:hypothetical protein
MITPLFVLWAIGSPLQIMLSIGALNAFIPIIIIIILIGAAAGLTRGVGLLDIFGFSALTGYAKTSSRQGMMGTQRLFFNRANPGSGGLGPKFGSLLDTALNTPPNPIGRPFKTPPKYTPSKSQSKFIKMAVAAGYGVKRGAWEAGRAVTFPLFLPYGGPMYALKKKMQDDPERLNRLMAQKFMSSAQGAPPPMAPSQLREGGIGQPSIGAAGVGMAVATGMAAASKVNPLKRQRALEKIADAKSKEQGHRINEAELKKTLDEHMVGTFVTEEQLKAAIKELHPPSYYKKFAKTRPGGWGRGRIKPDTPEGTAIQRWSREYRARNAAGKLKETPTSWPDVPSDKHVFRNLIDKMHVVHEKQTETFLKEMKNQQPDEWARVKSEAKSELAREDAAQMFTGRNPTALQSAYLAPSGYIAVASMKKDVLTPLQEEPSYGQDLEKILKAERERANLEWEKEKMARGATDLDDPTFQKSYNDKTKEIEQKTEEGNRLVGAFIDDIKPIAVEALEKKYADDPKFQAEVDNIVSKDRSGAKTEEELREETLKSLAEDMAKMIANESRAAMDGQADAELILKKIKENKLVSWLAP